MQVADDLAVFFHYTLTDSAGEVIDSSDGSDPLGYIHGTGGIIPGLQAEMAGKSAGDKFNCVIAPADAYGERNDEMIQKVPKEMFRDAPPEPGMQFQTQPPAGPHIFTVVDVSDTEVTVDGNHALAGETLNFAIEITEIREATAEEKDHGHIHGPGGHHH